MSRRPGPSLAERVAATKAAAAEQPAGQAESTTTAGKHCWVYAAPCSTTPRTAAVLVEWRQDASGEWEGRVVYAAQLGAQLGVIDTWVPSSLLEPRSPG